VNADYAARNGYRISAHRGNTDVKGLWYDPGVSAWKTPLFERPGFRKMWAKMRRGDTIIMLSLDRGWRSVQDFLNCYKEFLNNGVEVVFARGQIGFGGDYDTPMTRFILTGEANIAELKSELISERTKESWRARRRAKESIEACEEAAESGQIGKRLIKPIQYRRPEGNEWGEAYRKLKERRKDIAPPTGRVFGYCRVSTTDQSPVSQKKIVDKALQEFCDETGWARQHTFVDHGVSAFKVNWSLRPEGKKLWDQFQAGDHVFILCADRAFRSIRDMAEAMQELEDIGVILHFIRDGIRTDQGSGLRLLQSLAMAAQWEWEDQSHRIRLSMEKYRERFGVWTGCGIPRWMNRIKPAMPGGVQLIVDHDEVDRVIQITEMVRNKGKTTWTQLTRDVEQAMAERDGRRPIPVFGASLVKHRAKSTPEEKLGLRAMIRRRANTTSLRPVGINQGWKGTSEICPEVSRRLLYSWEERVWQKLVDYASVKPELFGDARDRILEMS
jgi:DNA invertase Pin-like site-specific DNA recombinase